MTAPIAAIIADAATTSCLNVARLTGRGQDRPAVRARWAAAWGARECLGAGPSEIGRALNKDHSSISYALEQADALRATDSQFRLVTDRLVERFIERNPRD